jgi:hypothetical protein
MIECRSNSRGFYPAVSAVFGLFPQKELMLSQITGVFEQVQVAAMAKNGRVTLTPQNNAGFVQMPAIVLKETINADPRGAAFDQLC